MALKVIRWLAAAMADPIEPKERETKAAEVVDFDAEQRADFRRIALESLGEAEEFAAKKFNGKRQSMSELIEETALDFSQLDASRMPKLRVLRKITAEEAKTIPAVWNIADEDYEAIDE
jgi:hypothetical protein